MYGSSKTTANNANTATTGIYTVNTGDTLSGIAKKLNTTVRNLVKLNNIKDTDAFSWMMISQTSFILLGF